MPVCAPMAPLLSVMLPKYQLKPTPLVSVCVTAANLESICTCGGTLLSSWKTCSTMAKFSAVECTRTSPVRALKKTYPPLFVKLILAVREKYRETR